MGALLGVAFGILLAIELIVVGVVCALVGMLVGLLWERSPWMGIACAAALVTSVVWFWRGRRREVESESPVGVYRGILLSRIPISGAAGSMYMLQFLVWAVASPAVGVGYAVLVAGGILLVPIAYHYNRPRRDGMMRMGSSALLGALFGLAFFSVTAARQVPLAALFGAATAAGVLGAIVHIWRAPNRRLVEIGSLQK